MRSKIGRKIHEETSVAVTNFVKKYGDLVVRIHQNRSVND